MDTNDEPLIRPPTVFPEGFEHFTVFDIQYPEGVDMPAFMTAAGYGNP